MYEQVEKPKENKSRAAANSVTQKKSNVNRGFGFVDNRSGVSQHEVNESEVNDNSRVGQNAQLMKDSSYKAYSQKGLKKNHRNGQREVIQKMDAAEAEMAEYSKDGELSDSDFEKAKSLLLDSWQDVTVSNGKKYLCNFEGFIISYTSHAGGNHLDINIHTIKREAEAAYTEIRPSIPYGQDSNLDTSSSFSRTNSSSLNTSSSSSDASSHQV